MAFEMRNGMIRAPQAWAQQDAEHEHLKQAVVEAAKAWEKDADEPSPAVFLLLQLREATRTLNAFEAEHVKGGE